MHLYMHSAAVNWRDWLQEGVVLWDARGSNDCRVGLAVNAHYAEALRSVAISCMF